MLVELWAFEFAQGEVHEESSEVLDCVVGEIVGGL